MGSRSNPQPDRPARGETVAHRDLKRLAFQWAVANGYRAVGLEVRLPRSGCRVDAAAYRKARGIGTTALFECKQARADFLKDARSARETIRQLEKLHQRRQTLERLLRVHEPNLRRGDSLFAEYDSLDTDQLQHKTYQDIRRKIRVLQNRLYGKTKFDKLIRYRCANLNYLVVAPGVLAGHEVPEGWGLLVQDGEELTLARRPVMLPVEEPIRLQLLHAIAVAGARYCRRTLRD